jgi:hypothetical protein
MRQIRKHARRAIAEQATTSQEFGFEWPDLTAVVELLREIDAVPNVNAAVARGQTTEGRRDADA